MFKEKLKKVQDIESQAAELLKKEAKKSAETIAEAKESAAEIERLASATAGAEAQKVNIAVDKEIADAQGKIAESSRLQIAELRERTAAALSKAAAEIVRRVTEGSGT